MVEKNAVRAPELDHEIGKKVKMVGAPDIDAIVTAYLVRQGGHVSYELTWIHDGEVKTGWLTTDSIEAGKKEEIGFKGGKSA